MFLTNQSQSRRLRLNGGSTVFLAKADSFWMKKMIVTETLEGYDDKLRINSLNLVCRELKTHSRIQLFQSRSLYLSQETFLLGDIPSDMPIYLLAGSRVNFTFTISADKTLSTKPEFFIFDSYAPFASFVDGGSYGVKNAVYRQILEVGTPQNPALSEVRYTMKKHGYYFMVGYSEAGITYQYNATIDIQYLNISDYVSHHHTCQVEPIQSCSFAVGNGFIDSSRSYCLIARIGASSTGQGTSHVTVETKKRYEVLLIPGVIAVVIVLLLVLSFTLCTSIVKKKKAGYRRIP